MFSPFERMMAFRYLRARKAEGFVSVIAGFSLMGIMLGVATLIIVMSVMNGFRAELVTRILGLNGHLNVYSNEGHTKGHNALIHSIEQIDGVKSVRGMVEGQVLISVSGTSSGALVRGLSREDFATKPILSEGITQGSFSDFNNHNIAIGIKMAERLKLKIGDSVTLLAPKGKATPFGAIPRSARFTIGVIFDVGMYEYNNGFIFMPMAIAQNFFRMGENISSLEIMLDSPQQAPEMKKQIQQKIGEKYRLYDWKDANSSFINALNVERNVMFLILTLIIVVAAFNIISSMIMLVKDKQGDIAILRTMGATRGAMLRIFILTGASIGIIGTALGAALGISFALNIEKIRQFLGGLSGVELFSDEIYFLSKLPAQVNWEEVVLVIGMALLLSIGATLYPALRAARLNPVEALRG